MERSSRQIDSPHRAPRIAGIVASGLLVFLLTGCYTQLATVERGPDHVEVVQDGDQTIVTEHFYSDRYLYKPYSYRRYFDRFDYGFHRDPFWYSSYDPFYYDPWYYSPYDRFHVGISFGFGWGHYPHYYRPHRYYPSYAHAYYPYWGGWRYDYPGVIRPRSGSWEPRGATMGRGLSSVGNGGAIRDGRGGMGRGSLSSDPRTPSRDVVREVGGATGSRSTERTGTSRDAVRGTSGASGRDASGRDAIGRSSGEARDGGRATGSTARGVTRDTDRGSSAPAERSGGVERETQGRSSSGTRSSTPSSRGSSGTRTTTPSSRGSSGTRATTPSNRGSSGTRSTTPRSSSGSRGTSTRSGSSTRSSGSSGSSRSSGTSRSSSRPTSDAATGASTYWRDGRGSDVLSNESETTSGARTRSGSVEVYGLTRGSATSGRTESGRTDAPSTYTRGSSATDRSYAPPARSSGEASSRDGSSYTPPRTVRSQPTGRSYSAPSSRSVRSTPSRSSSRSGSVRSSGSSSSSRSSGPASTSRGRN